MGVAMIPVGMILSAKKLLLNKYVIGVIVFLLYSYLVYDYGYDKRETEVQLERAATVTKLVEKVNSIYDLSVAKSLSDRTELTTTISKLDGIIAKSRKQPLTDVPCVPSENFSYSWSELDEVLINDTTK